MSILNVIAHKVSGIFFWIVNWIRSIILWRKRANNIGELPFTIPQDQRREFIDNSSDLIHDKSSVVQTWNSWNDHSFGIESKIAEYREQQKLISNKSNQPIDNTIKKTLTDVTEPDFFNEMQPHFKPTKKLKLKNENENKNLFQVRDNEVTSSEFVSNELGNLDFDKNLSFNQGSNSFYQNSDNWEDSSLGDADLDAIANDQKRRVREEKHRQRQAEHERRLYEKRQQTLIDK